LAEDPPLAPLRPPLTDRRGFILDNTRLQRPPHTPEIQLYLADEITPIWRMTEEALGEMGVPPPFWAFAWAGGQALARYVLDHPETVRGRRVLDFAAGSGLVGIAAMKAGASHCLCADVDDLCAVAISANAEANGVPVTFTAKNLLDAPPPEVDVMLAADISYEAPLAVRVRAWLAQAHARGATVLMGDPHRSYFVTEGLKRLADYQVETTRELEDFAVKRTGVWTFV
jgi:predicted nicotinamide N-methyase